MDFYFDDISITCEIFLKFDYSHNKESGNIVTDVIIHSTNNKKIAIENSESYTKLSFHVNKTTKNNAFDIITLYAFSITIGLEPSTFGPIKNGHGIAFSRSKVLQIAT